MPGEDSLERLLGAPNPFTDAALRNGFEIPTDVPEIHASARARLRGLVEQVRADGRPRLLVVTGAPGDGKTHLLAVLRAECEARWLHRGTEVALVPVEPLRDPEAPFGHLLRALAGGLSRELPREGPPIDAPATPLELLLWRALQRGAATLQQHFDEPVARAAQELVRLDLSRSPAELRMLLREFWGVLGPALETEVPKRAPFAPPEVDGEVWQVLCRFPRPELTSLALRWLGGHLLAEEDLARLGVPEPLGDEDRCFRALSTLLHLTDAPVVLGLDQLEGVRRLGDEAVKSLFDALAQLYSGGGRLLVAVFCQAKVWSELRAQQSQHVLDRLELPDLHLGNVPPEQGEQLVAARLAAIWRGFGLSPPHPTAPYPAGWVRKTIEENQLFQPRRVLSFFGRIGLTERPPGHVEPPPPADPRAVARREFEALVVRAGTAPLTAETRAASAQGALSAILRGATGTQLSGASVVAAGSHRVRKRTVQGLRAKLSKAGREVLVYAEASNSTNGASAAAAVKRLADSLQKDADRGLLVRDEGVPLPKGAERALQTMAGRGGVVRVPPGEAASLAAVEQLLNAAAAGDIEVSEELATRFVVEEIGPEIELVRRFVAAAFDGTDRAPAAPGGASSSGGASGQAADAVVASALARPPHVAAESELSARSRLPVERIAEAADRAEAQGSALVLRDKEGARAVVRRPR